MSIDFLMAWRNHRGSQEIMVHGAELLTEASRTGSQNEFSAKTELMITEAYHAL